MINLIISYISTFITGYVIGTGVTMYFQKKNMGVFWRYVLGLFFLGIYGYLVISGKTPGIWMNLIAGLILSHFFGWESIKEAIATRIRGDKK